MRRLENLERIVNSNEAKSSQYSDEELNEKFKKVSEKLIKIKEMKKIVIEEVERMKMIFDLCDENHRNNMLSEKELRAVNSNYDKAIKEQERKIELILNQTEKLKSLYGSLVDTSSKANFRQLKTIKEMQKLKENKEGIAKLATEFQRKVENASLVNTEAIGEEIDQLVIDSNSVFKNRQSAYKFSVYQSSVFTKKEDRRKHQELEYLREQMENLNLKTGINFSKEGMLKKTELVERLKTLKDHQDKLMELKLYKESLVSQVGSMLAKQRIQEKNKGIVMEKHKVEQIDDQQLGSIRRPTEANEELRKSRVEIEKSSKQKFSKIRS